MINLILKRVEDAKIASTLVLLAILAGGFSIIAVSLRYSKFIEMVKTKGQIENEIIIMSLVVVAPIIIYLFAIGIRTIIFTFSMIFLALDEGFKKVFSLMAHLALVEVSSSVVPIILINIFYININKVFTFLIGCPFIVFQIFIVNSFLYNKTSKRRRIVLLVVFTLMIILPDFIFRNSMV